MWENRGTSLKEADVSRGVISWFGLSECSPLSATARDEKALSWEENWGHSMLLGEEISKNRRSRGVWQARGC